MQGPPSTFSFLPKLLVPFVTPLVFLSFFPPTRFQGDLSYPFRCPMSSTNVQQGLCENCSICNVFLMHFWGETNSASSWSTILTSLNIFWKRMLLIHYMQSWLSVNLLILLFCSPPNSVHCVSHSHAPLPGKKCLRIHREASPRGAWLQQAASHCFLCFKWKCQLSSVSHGKHSKLN